MTDTKRIEAIDCPHCKSWVPAEVTGSVHYAETDFLVSLSECPKCGLPILFGQEIYPPGEVTRPKRLWPTPHPELPIKVPLPLRETFREAETCFAAGAYKATALMTRRFLDDIADHLGDKKSATLDQKIKWLHSEGHIDDKLRDWANALRLVGNSAAHDIAGSVTREDAEDILALAEAIADHLFVINARFADFQKRRSNALHSVKAQPPQRCRTAPEVNSP